ncbi:CS domain family protein [Candida albicans]|uniref:CS domain family protein n=1 Tax=Candida albicans TaxID=5476 RepID=A0A8H6F4X4_CANAX|nr:CS domain family protein [Candida albicans]
MSSTTTQTPTVLWAQRSSEDDAAKNIIYLTIQISDPIDLKIDLKSDHLIIDSKSNDSVYSSIDYHLQIDFFKEIDPDQSKINTENGSHIFMILRKKDQQEEYWPRLTKEKLKYHYIKTDFDKWVDEDEQDEVKDDPNDFGGPGGPGGTGGSGGPGGVDLSALASQLGQAGGAGGAAGLDGEEGEEGDEEAKKAQEESNATATEKE